MKYILLISYAFLLAACAGNNAATTTTTSEAEEAAMNGQDPTATVSSTVSAVETNGGDITALPLEAALANIESWIDQTEEADGGGKVAGNLEELQEALSEQPINGPLAGMLLITLAEDTRQVAGSQSGVSAAGFRFTGGG